MTLLVYRLLRLSQVGSDIDQSTRKTGMRFDS